MADTLIRRGPDDAGSWTDAAVGVALGFRRLAIIDLSPQGAQPMVSASGRFVLTFNGEIYNHPELKAELESAGARFRGHSDTEVMLAAFERWGLERSLRRFVGMFAFALWDRSERVLHLGRDRMGEKPLYYGRAGRSLVFGSELKALRAYPGCCPSIDRRSAARYMRYGYVPGPATIYKEISKLPPGTTLSVQSAEGALAAPVPYWSVRQSMESGLVDPFRGTEEEALDGLDQLLRDAVRGQMVADVPLGVFLSGGVDSSTVVALMQAQSARPVRTFTIGFHEPAYNEAEHAKAVARLLGTDHTEQYVTPADALAVVPKLATLYDEPFADPSSIPTYLMTQRAVNHATVCLSGDGGDELFAGYSWYSWVQQTWRNIERVPPALRQPLARAIRGVTEDGWNRTFRSLKLMLPAAKHATLTGRKAHRLAALLSAVRGPEDILRSSQTHWDESIVLGTDGAAEASDHLCRSAASERLSADTIGRMTLQDMMTYLPDDILVKIDRASMGVSLETRAPFLDHRVVEFAARVPSHWKWRDGQGKYILRRLLHRYVPPALIERPKAGFCVPVGEWLRGPLRDWAEDLLSERTLDESGLLDPAVVRRAWRTHQEGTQELGQQIWNVLMLLSWHEACV